MAVLKFCLSMIAAILVPTAIAAAPVPASALAQHVQTPTLSYRWRVAPEVAAEPALLQSLRSAAAADRARAQRAATADAAVARKNGYSFRRHQLIVDWRLAADTPKLLALIGETSIFSGGAHPNTGFAVRLWDKAANRSLQLPTLFTNWAKARKNIEADYCRALAQEQARRRGGTTPSGGFDTCPRLSDQAMTPWGGLGDDAASVRIVLPPYSAGPYSEGSYEITVSWPEAVKPLVKPSWRPTFFPSE